MDWKLLKDFGVAGLISIPFWFLIKWIAEEFKNRLKKYDELVEKSMNVFMGFQNTLNEHTAQAKSFHETNNEAHKFQREEHKDTAKILTEITSTLGRINGYKQ